MFGNLSKMFGGIAGGVLSGIVTNIAIPTLQTGSIFEGCQNALATASGNWVGAITTLLINGALGGLVTYWFPKNQKKVDPLTRMANQR